MAPLVHAVQPGPRYPPIGMAVLIVVLVLAYVAIMAWVIRRQHRRYRDQVIELIEAHRNRLVSLDRARANRYQPRHLKKGDN